MSNEQLAARLRATEIAVDALLAEIEELQQRLDEHTRVCPGEIQLP